MSERLLGGHMAVLLRRQLTLSLRRPVELLNPLLFFALVIVLFPLGLGPQPDRLAQFAPGILWIVALLATLLGSEGLFRSDFDDGSLDQLLLAPQPAYFSVLAFLAVHWLLSGVLLSLLSPLFAVMLGLPTVAIPALLLSLVLGSGVMTGTGCDRRGAHRGSAARWGADRIAGHAFLHAGTDLRCRRGAGSAQRGRCSAAARAAGRHALPGAGPGSGGDRRGPANQCRCLNLECGLL